MEPWSDQEARWIRRAAEDAIRERRPPGHELSAEEDREVNRLMVNRRLAGEARDLETYRIVHGRLVRLSSWGATPAGSGGAAGPGRGSVLREETRDGGPRATTGRGRRRRGWPEGRPW